MPSPADTRFRDRAFPRMLAQFGESVVYTPSGGSPSTISAIIQRSGLTEQGADSQSRYEYDVEIIVSQSDVATPLIGADTVALKKRLSDSSATTLRITALLAEDTGTWRLACN